jgi:hypothetical protein
MSVPRMISSLAWASGLPCSRVIATPSSSARSANLRGAVDDLGALGGRGVAPDLKALGGGVERVVEVGAGCVRHRAEDAFVGRVDHRRAVAAAPFTADIQFQLGV